MPKSMMKQKPGTSHLLDEKEKQHATQQKNQLDDVGGESIFSHSLLIKRLLRLRCPPALYAGGFAFDVHHDRQFADKTTHLTCGQRATALKASLSLQKSLIAYQ